MELSRGKGVLKKVLQYNWLATLLEGAGCVLKILNIKISNLKRLWCYKCYKLEYEWTKVKSNVSTIIRKRENNIIE